MVVNLAPDINTRYANYRTILKLLTQPHVDAYRMLSEDVRYTVEIGPYGGMHYTIGDDPSGDLFTSPVDPAFWAYHSQMDRMWTLWQMLGFSNEKYNESGKGSHVHRTWENMPPSGLVELSDVIDMGYAAPSTTIADVMSTTGGELYCFHLRAG
jgi:tyrosinase